MIQIRPFGLGTNIDYITIGYDAQGRKVRETYVDFYLDDCGPPARPIPSSTGIGSGHLLSAWHYPEIL
jgi:hypothetical protein